MSADEEPSKLVRLTPRTHISMTAATLITVLVGFGGMLVAGIRMLMAGSQRFDRLEWQVTDMRKEVGELREKLGEATRLEARVRNGEEWRAWATDRLPKKKPPRERRDDQ